MDFRLPLEPNNIAPEQIRVALDLYTEEELAAALKITDTTLAMWRAKSYGPKHIKLGKGIFYRRGDVQKWVYSDARNPQDQN